MSDQPSWPGWQPPDDDVPPGTAVPTGHVADRPSAGREPPPPPPPPQAWPPPAAWPPPEPPPSGGTGWQPPPTKRRTVPIVVAVATALLVIAVAAATMFVRAGSDRAGGPEVTEELRTLLETIDASERRMIGFQEEVFDVLGPEPDLSDHADEVAAAAEAAAADLASLHEDLRSIASQQAPDFDGLQEIRDTYAGHMLAWIDYVEAVAGTPALVLPDSADARPFWDDIESTGEEFVVAMTSELPEDAPQDLVDQADFILDRGFGGADEPPGPVI